MDNVLKGIKQKLGLGDDLTELDNIGKNLNAIRLSKLDLKKWIDEITKLGGKVRYFNEDKKMIKYFTENDCGAAFSARSIPPTIWIREGATDLELFHESMHFEDLLRRGKANYIKGVEEEVILPFSNKIIPKRDQLISKYIKEKYVLNKILEEQAAWIKKFGKGRWSEADLQFNKNDFLKYEIQCIKENIDISKITIKK